MLEARHLTVLLKGNTILSGVSLAVHPGDFIVVVGPNGAGKSTLLKCLSGELAPQSGAVWLNGKPIAQVASRNRAQTLAVLPQQSALQFPFTVREVVRMGCLPQARSQSRVAEDEIIRQTLEAVEMNHTLHRMYTTLSGGERQRVQLARVLAQLWNREHQHQSFLLLDEPTSSLDLAQQQCILTVARNLSQQGVGVFAVLHDLNLAAQYATKILILHQGRVRQQGTPTEVFTPETIETTFGIPVWVSPHPIGNDLVIVPVANR